MTTRAAAIALLLAISLPTRAVQGPRDPIAEAKRKLDKETAERNYRELKEAAAELSEQAASLNDDVRKGSEHVISARIFERIDRIEKAAKRIKDKARGF